MIRVTLQLCDIIQGIPQAMLGDLHIVTRTESDACVSSPKSCPANTLFVLQQQISSKIPQNQTGKCEGLQIQCRIIRFMIHHAKQLPSSWSGGMNAQMSMEARCAVGCNGMDVFIALVTKNIKPIILQDI